MLELPPDFTFVIQLVAFFVLLGVLRGLLFAPFAELLEERAARTVGDVERAAASRAELAALAAKVDAELAASRASAKAEVDALRANTRDEAARLFESAQQEAASRLGELRRQVETATQEARGQLSSDARSLADAMVSAVLGGGSR